MLDKGVFAFKGISPSNLVDEALKFDPNKLDQLLAIDVSKYCAALGQYLIYFTYEVNKLKAELTKKKKILNDSLMMALTKETVKEHGTKAAATNFLINTVADLSKLDKEIEAMKEELTLVDGIDKTVSEFIMVFKRELTRREQELFTTRAERRI